MPKSRKNKNRKEQLDKYKKIKQIENIISRNMSEIVEMKQEERALPDGIKIRSVPKWRSNDILDIAGIELDILYNGSLKEATAILESVMNRNILNGKVQVDFEKIAEDGSNTYIPLTEEEAKPYKDEFNNLISAMKQAQQQRNEEPKQEAKIVGLDGNPVTTE